MVYQTVSISEDQTSTGLVMYDYCLINYIVLLTNFGEQTRNKKVIQYSCFFYSHAYIVNRVRARESYSVC